MPSLEVLGIRHYSPACARLVRARIAALKPHTVLIEGPSDFNERLHELALPHTLPIAIYSFYGDDAGTASCHAPFAEFAPEWAALDAARAVGARVRFIDLPYWHAGAQQLPQRYTLNTLPGRERYARVSRLLQQRCGIDGEDALWDHLFERDADAIGVDAERTEALRLALEHYFDELRADERGHPSDQAREAHMREWIAWACATPGPVVVVCGGWHRGALLERQVGHGEGLARSQPVAGDDPHPHASADRTEVNDEARNGSSRAPCPVPRAPSPTSCPPPRAPLFPPEPTLTSPPELTRVGSYLVPYSELQLDAYAGYGAGMPSPLWYRWQWRDGTAAAARNTLTTIVRALRQARQSLPTAQLVQARARILGLAQLRGHAQPLRSDVLDGLLDALVDSALDEPPPWTARTPPGRATDARLRAALRALAGDSRGELAAGTPQPPLVDEVLALLAAHDFVAVAGPRKLELDRRRRDDSVRAEILWRLRTLEIDGFALDGIAASGAARALSADQHYQERWTLSAPGRQRAQLIEAGAWGATLAEAAARKLEDRLRGESTPAQLLDAVLAALRCGYHQLGERLAAAARDALATSSDWSALAQAGRRLSALADAGFWGSDLGALLDPLLDLVEQRLSWLIEGRLGASAAADPADINAVRFLAWRRARSVAADHATALAELLQRRALDPDAAPALRGAAAGALWQAAQADTTLRFDETAVIAAVRRLPTAQVLGDWLIGLFALARDAVTRAPTLIAALDALIGAQGDTEFLSALPALRQAFNWFPPRERAAIAEQVARLHGHGSGLAAALLTLPDDVGAAARGAALQHRVRELSARWGLLP
jgi:hypothetical protein